MRILGIDFGQRRIGVAVSDPTGLIAQNIEVIDREKCVWQEKVETLIKEYQVESLVIGYPKNMNGTVGEKGLAVEEVAAELKTKFNLPVHLWDERLSTVAVQRVLTDANYGKNSRKVIDKLAAAWILQGFLDKQRRNENG